MPKNNVILELNHWQSLTSMQLFKFFQIMFLDFLEFRFMLLECCRFYMFSCIYYMPNPPLVQILSDVTFIND